MSKLKFDQPGQRFYESGVSSGVLFVANMGVTGEMTYNKGVAWNGLISVTESPEGGDLNNVYADNIKYLSLRAAEDFKATIECYTYPDEFAQCNGEAEIANGVYIGQQNRRTFAFAYVTNVGNDVSPDVGYKLHIIYGASASPSERNHESINDSPEAMSMSFEIDTVPVEVQGFKPTAHLVLDYNKVAPGKLNVILDSLFGTDPAGGTAGTDPTLLLPDDIIRIINDSSIPDSVPISM